MEKSGSSGASGRCGKDMAAGCQKGVALRSRGAGSRPGEAQGGSPSGLGTDVQRAPEGALTLQLRPRKEWPPPGQTAAASVTHVSGLQPRCPDPAVTAPRRGSAGFRSRCCRENPASRLTGEASGTSGSPASPTGAWRIRDGQCLGRDISKRESTPQRASLISGHRGVLL